MHVLERQQGWCARGGRVRCADSRHRGAQRARGIRGRLARGRSANAPMNTWCARRGAGAARRGLGARSRTRGARGPLGRARRPAHRGGRGRPAASRLCCMPRSGSRGRWSPSARRSGPIIPRWRAGSARSCRFRSTRRCATPSVRSRAWSRRRSRSWSTSRPSRFSECTIRRAAEDYPDPEPALEHARARVARTRARGGAPRRRGRSARRDERERKARARRARAADYLAEAVARSTATGRPFAGHIGACATPSAHRIKAYRARRHIEKAYDCRCGNRAGTRAAARAMLPYNRLHETTRRDARPPQPAPPRSRRGQPCGVRPHAALPPSAQSVRAAEGVLGRSGRRHPRGGAHRCSRRRA